MNRLLLVLFTVNLVACSQSDTTSKRFLQFEKTTDTADFDPIETCDLGNVARSATILITVESDASTRTRIQSDQDCPRIRYHSDFFAVDVSSEVLNGEFNGQEIRALVPSDSHLYEANKGDQFLTMVRKFETHWYELLSVKVEVLDEQLASGENDAWVNVTSDIDVLRADLKNCAQTSLALETQWEQFMTPAECQ